MRVAFLGLGRIGGPMAANVCAGHDVNVWNRSPGRAGEQVDLGAREAEDVADAVRDADVVALSLFDAASVRDVLGEVIVAARPGTLVVNLTTVSAPEARELATEATDAGLRYVDAPVVGSVGPAREGKLRVLVGADDADAADAEPVLSLLGTVVRTGPVGSASALKVVGNLALALAAASAGEALRLAHSQGIGLDATLDALSAGPLGAILGYKREMIVSGTFRPAAFTLDALAKDVGLARSVARQSVTSSDLPLTDALAGRISGLAAAGHGEDDFGVLAAYPADVDDPDPSLFD